MATDTDIANLALYHLGVGVDIADLTTESSTEAAACRKFFDQARQQTLRDFEWPFASKQAALGLVTTAPTTEWSYSYQYPADCLKFRRILSGTRNDSYQSRVPFKIVYGTSGNEIYTDFVSAVGEYTVDVTGAALGRMTEDFVMAVSLRLAAYIAPRLTAGDPFKMGQRAMQLYQVELGLAAANAYNEEQGDITPESEFVRGRD